ncbi:hypothetical protein EBR43_10530, partial [bacterium]|nr:hypothetical protein [bacterium]
MVDYKGFDMPDSKKLLTELNKYLGKDPEDFDWLYGSSVDSQRVDTERDSSISSRTFNPLRSQRISESSGHSTISRSSSSLSRDSETSGADLPLFDPIAVFMQAKRDERVIVIPPDWDYKTDPISYGNTRATPDNTYVFKFDETGELKFAAPSDLLVNKREKQGFLNGITFGLFEPSMQLLERSSIPIPRKTIFIEPEPETGNLFRAGARLGALVGRPAAMIVVRTRFLASTIESARLSVKSMDGQNKAPDYREGALNALAYSTLLAIPKNHSQGNKLDGYYRAYIPLRIVLSPVQITLSLIAGTVGFMKGLLDIPKSDIQLLAKKAMNNDDTIAAAAQSLLQSALNDPTLAPAYQEQLKSMKIKEETSKDITENTIFNIVSKMTGLHVLVGAFLAVKNDLKSPEYPGLDDPIRAFLRSAGVGIKGAVLGLSESVGLYARPVIALLPAALAAIKGESKSEIFQAKYMEIAGFNNSRAEAKGSFIEKLDEYIAIQPQSASHQLPIQLAPLQKAETVLSADSTGSSASRLSQGCAEVRAGTEIKLEGPVSFQKLLENLEEIYGKKKQTIYSILVDKDHIEMTPKDNPPSLVNRIPDKLLEKSDKLATVWEQQISALQNSEKTEKITATIEMDVKGDDDLKKVMAIIESFKGKDVTIQLKGDVSGVSNERLGEINSKINSHNK